MILRKIAQNICSCIRYRTYFTCPVNNLFKSKLNNFRSKHSLAKYSDQVYNVNTNVVKDVILYKYENPTFFKVVNIFALCQFGFWAYLSHFAFTTLRNVPVSKNIEESNIWWRKINLGESKYRNGLTVISFAMGYGILAVAWMFTLKSVRYLILRKGGQAVTFVTYGPFGRNRMMTVDLKHVSSKETRGTARTYLPIKVENQYLHYILDMKGEFKNTKLFDSTAGLKRRFQ